jgi:CheY-like chemotaxis protein/nitrogen-specific signal transduction histidine kinase
MAAIQGRKAYYLRRERDLARQVEAKTAEVRRAMDAAETANRAKSRFLAVMGHEIRTPLNGLLGILQLLEGSAFGKDARGLLNSAKVAGNTLRTLVESILDYGVEGDEGGGLLISDVNLESLLSETMELVRPQAALKNLTLSLRIEPEHPGNIRSDYARLFRILSNLLGNAVKFTERGSIEVGAVLTSAQDGMAKLTITVTDTGIGIAEHMIDSIFAEFTQVDDSNRRKYGGVGLGLAVSRRIAIRMGGTLSAESRIGQGSCFRLDIPVVVTPEIDKVENEGGKRGAALRVLVVDDDELNRRVAERLLAHLGHRVTVASGGKEALAAAAAAPFDVVLMDLWMPGMDGYETAQGIRALPTIHPGHLRILAMSADLSEETRQRCADTGMDGSLAKPVLLGALREALAASPPLALPLDQDFLEEQVDILGPEEMIRLSKMFRRASWTMLHAIDDALAKEDRTALAAIAHRLRSSSGPVGLVTVANYAARIQMDAPEAPLAVLREQVEALRQARLAGLKALSQMARTNYGRSTVSPKR